MEQQKRWRGLRTELKAEGLQVIDAGDITAPERAWIDAYHAAFERYLQKDWDGAVTLFGGADRKRGGDAASQHMIQRCIRLRETPPPTDWDGTDMADSK